MVTTHVHGQITVPLLFDGDIEIPLGPWRLGATLTVPRQARGLVIFAHGSGSSRFSPRNRAVAADLQDASFATLLLDLLTADEEEIDRRTAQLRFDVEMLGARLARVTDWAGHDEALNRLPVGYFGASTGAAAALLAAAARPSVVRAVVSRGGRPDLAARALGWVRAPTLLIVGEFDEHVLPLNRDAFDRLECERQLEVVPEATHLFEESGALERVAMLAVEWFEKYLADTTGSDRGGFIGLAE